MRLLPSLLATTVLFSAPAQAQGLDARDSVGHSPKIEGRAAGIAAAERIPASTFFLPGLLAGVSIGAAGPLLNADGNKTAPAFLAGAGIAIIVTTLGNGPRRNTPPLGSGLAENDIEYRKAFDAGYAERLRQKRRNAVALGAVSGTVAGIAAMQWLLSQLLKT